MPWSKLHVAAAIAPQALLLAYIIGTYNLGNHYGLGVTIMLLGPLPGLAILVASIAILLLRLRRDRTAPSVVALVVALSVIPIIGALRHIEADRWLVDVGLRDRVHRTTGEDRLREWAIGAMSTHSGDVQWDQLPDPIRDLRHSGTLVVHVERDRSVTVLLTGRVIPAGVMIMAPGQSPDVQPGEWIRPWGGGLYGFQRGHYRQ